MKFFEVKSVEETLSLIKKMVEPVTEKITLPLLEALHYCLAEHVYVRENVPAFRRSTVDGYAIKARDSFGASETLPGFLNVTGEVKMGQVPDRPIKNGEAMYVPTGGMLPEGSDAVIMIEHCENIDGLLNIYRQTAPGENVISVGEDLKENEILVEKGTRLRPQELAALASQGITEVTVYRKPVIGYLSSGDEIVPMETDELQIGEIRDMNGAAIGGLVKEWGLEFRYGGIVKDNREEFEQKARAMLEETDCLVISGGSSVGAKDYSVQVIDSLGTPGVYVHGISVKPGKPTILSIADKKPVIGLPGHPASAMIIFSIFGKAVLERLKGIETRNDRVLQATVTKNIPSSAGRTDYVRVRLFKENGQLYAEPVFGKSGLISTLVKSDGILEVPEQSEGILKGAKVPITLFG